MFVENVVDKEYWNLSYANLDLQIVPKEDDVRKFLEHNYYIQENKLGSCFEIGAYPGRYLAVFGELGYQLNGIDQNEFVATRLPEWLNKSGYNVGFFEQSSIETFAINQKFNMVYSIGFIEHFKNYEQVILKHLDFMADDGTLFISVPNFKGLAQRILHSLVDRENLNRHVLESMNPQKWAKLLLVNGVDVKSFGYFGGFDFWVDNQPRNIFQRGLLKAIFKLRPILKKNKKKDSSIYSAYCYIIAKKV